MGKKNWVYLLIIFVIVVIFIKNLNNNSVHQYSTTFEEINNLLNTEDSKFKLVSSLNSKKSIYINSDEGVIEFKNNSILKDINNENKTQINYKSENNFISILKLNNSKNMFNVISFDHLYYNNESGYYLDELKNPIIILNYNNTKFLYCNNLKSNSSRNYLYYDIDNMNQKSIKVKITRANEIYFWYNDCFYYVGIDINLETTELIELVRYIIKNC